MSQAKVSSSQKNKTKQDVTSNSNRNINAVSTITKTKRKSSLTPCIEPWNHKQFLQRVETYNSVKWFAKPSEVNPLLCARYGWECMKINTLQCTGCGTKITYKSNATWNNETNKKMAQSFLINIKNAHIDDCVWKNNPSPSSFERLPMNTRLMKQQLIENMKTWTQTDPNGFYIVPKIDPKAKKTMLQSISSNDTHSWTNYASCCSIMLLCGSGWYLKPIFNSSSTSNANSNSPLSSNITSITPYVQCRYCNRCVSLQSYDYKKIISLLPEGIITTNTSSASLFALNSIREDAEEDEEKKEMTEMTMDIEEENEVEDLSTIWKREFSTSDTSAVMEQLSKMGLKLQSNISRTHCFQIYETKSLQQQAQFHSITNSVSPSKANSNAMSLISSPFGSGRRGSFGGGNVGGGGFGANLSCLQSMRWPKNSILTQPSSKQISLTNTTSQKKRNKKRSRNQMTSDDESMLSVNDEFDHIIDEEQRPRKKMKIQSININDENSENNTKNDENEMIDSNKNIKKNKPRKSRKRKTMDQDNDDDDSEFVAPNSKKRRISNVSTESTTSSVSTTISIPSSGKADSSESSPLNQSKNVTNFETPKKKLSRSRKRKFITAFADVDEDNNEEEDEDDDVKENIKQKLSVYERNRPPSKRARLDTPTVASRLYFDPINLHHKHCPFLLQHQYQQNNNNKDKNKFIVGWNYCLQLMPKDIIYLKQLVHASKKKESK